MRITDPEERAFFSYLYRKHVKTPAYAKMLTLWWNIQGRKMYQDSL